MQCAFAMNNNLSFINLEASGFNDKRDDLGEKPVELLLARLLVHYILFTLALNRNNIQLRVYNVSDNVKNSLSVCYLKTGHHFI